MKVVDKRLFRHVNDPMQMPEELNKLQDELIQQGYTVKPRSGPVVIIELEGGEVHYCPGQGGIWQYMFETFEERRDKNERRASKTND